jgi:predicted HTH domain antitoxin
METEVVTVEIPQSVLQAAGVQEHDLLALIRETVAVDLYRRGQLSLGKAAEVAGVATKWEMLAVLAKHDVWLDYSAEDALRDTATLEDVLSR